MQIPDTLMVTQTPFPVFARPLCSFRCSSQFRPVDPLVVAMGSQELQEFHKVIFVSAMALESVVLWDDIVEKFEDNPTLCTSLGVTLQELTDVAQTMKQLMDRAHDRKSDLQRTLEAALQPVQDMHPRRLRSELDEMWEAADAAHAHLPTETESVPLLNAPPLQAEADESAFRDDQDHEDPAGSD